MLEIGIDPSRRNTGIAIRRDGVVSFDQIRCRSQCIVEDMRFIRKEIRRVIKNDFSSPKIRLCFERQLSVGAYSSSLMFLFQEVLLEELYFGLKDFDVTFIYPLPNQLRSFLKKTDRPFKNDTDIVAACKNETKETSRVSIHKADAYFLMELGVAVQEGIFKYKIPTSDPVSVPWRILNE